MTTIQEFNQIDGRISSLYHAAALKMGLSDSEFRILYTLAVNAPGYLQSALREATGMGRSTVNSALKKLEREGILTLSPGSGRHTCVSLTAQGHRLADRTVCRLIRLENRIYAGWTSVSSCIHVKLLKIVSHLIKFCSMMLVMLQHIGKKCYSLILAVTILTGTAVPITVCMTMAVSFRMAVCMAVSHTILMGVLMCMFMAICMSMLNKIAILIFD